jgi:hypothetical protein
MLSIYSRILIFYKSFFVVGTQFNVSKVLILIVFHAFNIQGVSLESHISYFKIQKHVQEEQGHVDAKCMFVLYFCFELEFML